MLDILGFVLVLILAIAIVFVPVPVLVLASLCFRCACPSLLRARETLRVLSRVHCRCSIHASGQKFYAPAKHAAGMMECEPNNKNSEVCKHRRRFAEH